MGMFNIGLSALGAATTIMDVAADNIANANTPGYHAKETVTVPLDGTTVAGLRVGLGVSVTDVKRVRDAIIERALLDHIPLKGMFGQEADTLARMEMLFSEPSDAGLDQQMGQFFDALTHLTVAPDDAVLQEQVVQKAHALCGMFNQLADGLDRIAEGLVDAAESLVSDVNDLTLRIADLNGTIQRVRASGTSAPDLEDRRDQLITDLADCVNVRLHHDERGVVNVSTSGSLLVHVTDSTPLAVSEEDGRLVITRPGGIGIPLPITGGRIAGVLSLVNDLLPTYRSALDELADSLRRSVNLVHTTAISSGGRFHSLEGTNAFTDTEPFYQAGYGVQAGTAERLYINVEDESAGGVTRHELVLDTTLAADAFLVALRDAINDPVSGVDHVTATIGEGRLNLSAQTGYAFGFAAPYDPDPAGPGDITTLDPTVPVVLDAYTGGTDLDYTVRFLDGGRVGTDGITIEIEVREPSGPLLRTFTRTIGPDYVSGAGIALENGLKLGLSEGDVNAGDSFSFVANTGNDTAGVLDALGLNTFFGGLGAARLHVQEPMLDDSGRLCTSLRSVAGDNHRVLAMAALAGEPVADGNTETMAEFYRSFLSDIAITRNTRQARHDSQEQILHDLSNRRDGISGVSTDEELIKILQARSMYQGATNYIRAVSQMLDYLATVL